MFIASFVYIFGDFRWVMKNDPVGRAFIITSPTALLYIYNIHLQSYQNIVITQYFDHTVYHA